MTEVTLSIHPDEWEIVLDGPLCAWAELDNRTIFIRDPDMPSRKLGYTLREDEYLIRRKAKEQAMDGTQPTLTTLEKARQKMMSNHDAGYGNPAVLIAFAQAEALTRIADYQHSAFNYVVSEILEMTEVLKRIADALEAYVATPQRRDDYNDDWQA